MPEEEKLPQTSPQATIALIAPYRQPCHLLLSLTICEPISLTKSKPSPLQQIYQLGYSTGAYVRNSLFWTKDQSFDVQIFLVEMPEEGNLIFLNNFIKQVCKPHMHSTNLQKTPCASHPCLTTCKPISLQNPKPSPLQQIHHLRAP